MKFGGNLNLAHRAEDKKKPVSSGHSDGDGRDDGASGKGDGFHHHEIHENESGFHSRHTHPDGQEEHADHASYQEAEDHMRAQMGQEDPEAGDMDHDEPDGDESPDFSRAYSG